MRQPTLWIVQYLLNELNLQFDSPDSQDRTPFSIGIDTQILKHNTLIDKAVNLLIEKKANIDYPDEANQTPYLKLYNAQLREAAELLREKGANVNQMNNSGIFALKIALIRREDAEIKRLVSVGANINQIDQKGRNLLHFAINMSSSTADATFETEQLLIDLGVDINVRDSLGRVPLHYAFVKIKDYANKT